MEPGSPPAAWYADPSGRHEHRYWSGSAWTEHVADHGQQSADPLAPAAGLPGAEQPGGWPPPQPGGMPGATPGPAYGPAGGIGQPADLGVRFVARLIDSVLVGLVTAILGGLVAAGLLLGSHASVLSSWGFGAGTSRAANAVSAVITAVITLGYFTLMESRRGQTLGKMVFKLQTRGPGGGHPTTEQALKRNAFTAIPIIGAVPFLGPVSSLLSLIAVITIAVTIHRNTATRQGWHDDLAGGTSVVRIG
jgi:uncharacterized RDD family membrane protein YckC